MNEDTYRDKLNDLQLEVEELRAKLAQSTMGQVNDLSQSTKTDTISRQAAIDAMGKAEWAKERLRELPSAQPETCEGCKHLGKWENEVEYGYPSPCTSCKRRVEDHYER